MTLDPP